MKIITTLFIIAGFVSFSIAQSNFSYKTSEINKYPKRSVINVKEVNNDWDPNIQLIEMPAPGSEKYSNYLQKLKASIPPKKRDNIINSEHLTRSLNEPSLLYEFDGNHFNVRVPNDNDIAVSDNDNIVSVSNSIIYFFNNDSLVSDTLSLEAFASELDLPQSKYDPRVLYDPDEDKFVLVFLNGYNDSTSHIIVAFSASNDPTGNWNIYSLPGNPLNDTSWSDFPMIALTKDELFLTINLLKNDEHWKTGFKQTLVWQINKQSGFAGDTSLITKHYFDIKFDGNNIRNLCPIQGGSELMGPNIYLLSNKNFSLNCDSVFIAEISDVLTNPATDLTVNLSISDSAYGVPPLADQPYNRKFETNDARILDGYLENNTIHFVGNTVNFDNNLATIFHGKISNASSSQSVNLNIIRHPYLEFGYPSLAYTGTSASPDEFIMLFNHSADSVNPGMSSLFYKDGNYSSFKRLKEGATHVTVQSQPNQRWGDYTGLQRKYNESGAVWGSGYYGKRRTPPPPDPFSRVNGTWIVKLKSPTYLSADKNTNDHIMSRSYPNPAQKHVFVEFSKLKTGVCKFRLYDVNGKLIKLLRHDLVKKGDNIFSFNLTPLKAGTYFLIISENENICVREKIIVTR